MNFNFNIKKPSYIFILLVCVLFLISVVLGTNIIEGMANDSSNKPVYSTMDMDSLNSGGKSSVPDFTKPISTGDSTDVGFGTIDGDINVVSGSMNPLENVSNNIMEAYGPGINKSQIPKGDEDLYILKSQIVPPVCPACPTVSSCPRKEAAPPCPACARCPEPAFDCKKVPNYSSNDDRYLPRPILADFSQFGM